MKSIEPKVLVFTATYNERENVTPLIEGIWGSAPHADIFVIDDNSPDGTGEVLDSIAKENSKLKIRHRAGKLGVGSAHREAINYARENGYQKLITMDADFSHDPKVIQLIVESLNQYEYVVGSRFVDGGKLDYHGLRRLISFGANFLSRYALGITCRETTTSFRGFNDTLLARLPINEVKAEGYSFFLECTYIICRTTKSVLEIPIHFQDRRYGKSKISRMEIYNGLLTVLRLFLSRLGFFF
jgi:dolichol-phosphate mannosyltransferase